MIQGIRRSAPALFHKYLSFNLVSLANFIYFRCPFKGIHAFKNVTLSNDVIAIFPSGNFHVVGHGQDKLDSKIFMINVTFSIKL